MVYTLRCFLVSYKKKKTELLTNKYSGFSTVNLDR